MSARLSSVSVSVFLTIAVVCILMCDSGNSQAHDVIGKTEPIEDKVMTSEYCAFEYFNATCRSPDELVYIHNARYGRMRIGGRCVKVDLGYVGCAADVTHVIAARCSARARCSISVGDNELRIRKPCPTDVTWYLEVSYSCISVMTRDESLCLRREPLPVLHPGFIGSSSHVTTTPGDCSTTWSLEPLPWQRIRISLVGLYARNKQHRCAVLGSVSESSGRRTVLNSCRSDGPRTTLNDDQIMAASIDGMTGYPLYTANTSDALTITLTIPFDDSAFLLRFDAVGCTAYTSNPTGSTVRRLTNDRLVVQCNNTVTNDEFLTSWTVACRNGLWVPSSTAMAECPPIYLATTGYQTDGENSTSLTANDNSVVWHEFFVNDVDSSTVPLSILLAVAVGVSMGIFLGGVLLAVVWPRISRRFKTSTQNGVNSSATSNVVPSPQPPVTTPSRYATIRPCYYVCNPTGTTNIDTPPICHGCGLVAAPMTSSNVSDSLSSFPLTVLPPEVMALHVRSSMATDDEDDNVLDCCKQHLNSLQTAATFNSEQNISVDSSENAGKLI